jgi:hypothetical protein
MPESESPITEQLEHLHRMRDELRLRVHLGADEAREEWERAEVLWDRLQGEVHRLGEVSRRPSRQLKNAAGTLVREVGVAYSRIRTALQRDV